MIVRGTTFTGCCANTDCTKESYGGGGIDIAIESSSEDEDVGDLICLACATRLQVKLVKAIGVVKARMAEGKRCRGGKWVKP